MLSMCTYHIQKLQASEEQALSVHNNDRAVLKALCNTKASTGGVCVENTLMCLSTHTHLHEEEKISSSANELH